MKEILDRSENYLRIFINDNFKIDYSLPKYRPLLEKLKKHKGGEEAGAVFSDEVAKLLNNYFTDDMPRPVNAGPQPYKASEKGLALMKDLTSQLVDKEFFENLTADDLTIIVDREKGKGLIRKYYADWVVDVGTPNILNPVFVEEGVSGEKIPSNSLSDGKTEEEKKPSIWARLKEYWRKKDRTEKDLAKVIDEAIAEEEEAKDPDYYKLDVMAFFDLVKLETQKETEDYYNRISPYLVALKKAKQMGQEALVDQWLGRLFIIKYESFLRASGFHHKISEAQLVNFIKKTKKGVALTWVKNFAHPIPDEVIERKLKADSLHVFDNYVILHYDPEGKVYAPTEKEREEERQRRADPILFGVLEESHDLYYIADWVDEYCDLTLDKFLEVSGLDKAQLEIDEKIKI